MKHFLFVTFPFVFLSLPLTGSHSRIVSSSSSMSQQFRDKQLSLYHVASTQGYLRAIPGYRQAAEDSKRLGYPDFSLRFLNNVGACQLAAFQYRDALKSFTEVRALAEKADDQEMLSVVGSNLSAVFMQMGNLQESADAAERALIYKDHLKPVSRAKLFAQLGNVRTELGEFDRAEVLFKQAIEEALNATDPRGQPDTETAAWAWDALGFSREKAGHSQAAEQASAEGLRLRKLTPVSALESSYMILGIARASQGDFSSGISLLNEAERSLHLPGSRTAPWRIYEARGRIKLQAGLLEPALRDLRTALSLARTWRVDIIENDANRIGTEQTLAELYGSLIEAGNRLYLQNHDPALIRETFEAAEENRVASLRAILSQRDDWRSRLTPGYMIALGQLQASEAQWLREGQSAPPDNVRQLRYKLAEMEAEAGAPAVEDHSQALKQARRTLDANSAYFSFQLGDHDSWVWAVTDRNITVHQLPGRSELARSITQFDSAARSDASTVASGGTALYASLFGSIEPASLSRRRWLLALDGPLFNLPFPALPSPNGEPLIVSHSLQVATGALMLQDTSKPADFHGPFLGIGDPVYNAADPRMPKRSHEMWPFSFSTMGKPARNSPQFARLWGTGREVWASARAWNAPANIVLSGEDATEQKFWESTKQDPAIIHLATHILESNNRLRTGWIALSMNRSGELDYLTPEQIAARSVRARLVVLSGCSSGKAEVRTASGLMGLTRAWIAAGAGAVLATRWPTVDDDGAFFESFYRNLRENKSAGPSEALREASLEMIRSGTWRSKSSFWSGYFLVENN